MSDRRDPSALSIGAAVDRYLQRRQADATESTIHAYRYRLKLFIEWCQDLGINTVGELKPLDLDEYYEHRAAKAAPATLEGEMWALRGFLEYLENLSAVDDLSEAVRVPDVSQEERSNETRLDPSAAIQLIKYYRQDDTWYATRQHALLELAWFTGARQGALRSLDLRDVEIGDNYVQFRHRPDTGTPLKNKRKGERPVGLPSATMAVIGEFVRSHRYDVHDEHGRQPLLASRQGRPGENTVRVWCYLATLPCLHSPCPHGRERQSCNLTEYAHASKCPSSRSPHRIRTGSISWQLDQGLPPEVVSTRVDASFETIEKHYDKSTPLERLESRRRPHLNNLSLES